MGDGEIMRDCLKTMLVGNSKSLRWKGLRAYAEKPKPKGRSPPQRSSTQPRPSPFTSPSLQVPHPSYHRFPGTSSSFPSRYQSPRFYLVGVQCPAAGLRKSLHSAPPAGGWLPLPSTRGEQTGRRAARMQRSQDVGRRGAWPRQG